MKQKSFVATLLTAQLSQHLKNSKYLSTFCCTFRGFFFDMVVRCIFLGHFFLSRHVWIFLFISQRAPQRMRRLAVLPFLPSGTTPAASRALPLSYLPRTTALCSALLSTSNQKRRNYHERVIDHYENPRNVGSLDKASPYVGTGLVGAPACGDVMVCAPQNDNHLFV